MLSYFSLPLVGRAGVGRAKLPHSEIKKERPSFLKKRSKKLLFLAAP
jgi:hypothetical protein